VVIWWSRGG